MHPVGGAHHPFGPVLGQLGPLQASHRLRLGLLDAEQRATGTTLGSESPDVLADGQALGLGIGVGADHRYAECGHRRGALGRGSEAVTVAGHGLGAEGGGDEVGEAEAQAETGGQACAVAAGAEDPDLWGTRASGHGPHLSAPSVLMVRAVQEVHHLGHPRRVLLVGHGLGFVAQSVGGGLVGTGGPAQSEVDAAGEQGVQHPEGLGHLEGAVVGEEHAAGTDPDGARPAGDVGGEDLGGGAGQRGGVVVLGQPVAAVAERLDGLGQGHGVAECLGGRRPVGDRRLVHHAQGDHETSASSARRSLPRAVRGRAVTKTSSSGAA